MFHFIWIVYLSIHVSAVSANEVGVGQKLKFLSSFITANPGKFYMYLPSWNSSQKRELFKQCQGFVEISPNSNLISKPSIQVYDLATNHSEGILKLRIPSDNSPKLLLASDDIQLDMWLKDINLLPSRNAIVAKFVRGNEELVKISRCYRLLENVNSSIVFDYIMTWRTGELANHGIQNLHLSRMIIKRINFHGMKLPVAIVLSTSRSFERLRDFRDVWVDTYTKANYGPIMKLFAYVNITPEFVLVPNYEHLKSLNDNKFILTVTAPYMTKEFLSFVDFLKVAPPTKLCYMLRQPATSFVTTIFTVTFTPGVWYAMLGLLVILSSALYLLLNQEARRADTNGKIFYNVYDVLLLGLEAICQQGTTTAPRSYASRTLQVFMFLAFMFLYVAYSANILVLLQSTAALSHSSQLQEYGIPFAGLNTSMYNYYPRETAERLFQTNINSSTVYSAQEGMELVRRGIFAFYSESRYGDMYARHFYSDYEVCSLQQFGARYDFNLGYAAIAKNSGYTDLFKAALLQITEKGFANRHYLRYFSNIACYSQGSSFDAIGIREIYQALVLVAIGVLSSVLVFLLEIRLAKRPIHIHLPDIFN